MFSFIKSHFWYMEGERKVGRQLAEREVKKDSNSGEKIF